MIMNDALTRKAAKEFAEYWKDKGYEKGKAKSSGSPFFVTSV